MGQLNRFPRYTEVAPTARTVVIGTVVESRREDPTESTVVFTLRVDDVIRGQAPAAIEVEGIRSGLPRRGQRACRENAFLYVHLGDVIALALDGRLDGRAGITTAAWIEGRPERDLIPGVHVLSRSEAIAAARALPPTDAAPSTTGRPVDRSRSVERTLVDGDVPPPASIGPDDGRHGGAAVTCRSGAGAVHAVPTGSVAPEEPVVTAAPDASAAPTGTDPTPPIGPRWLVTLAGTDGKCRMDQVVAWQGGFAGMGEDSVWRSPDGISWRRTDGALPGGAVARQMTMLAYRDSLLVVGVREGDLAVWESRDAKRWRRIRSPSFAVGGTLLSILGVAARDGRLLVLGGVSTPGNPRACETGPCPNVTRAWESGDGRSWRDTVVRDASGRVLRDDRGRPLMIERAYVGPDGFLSLGESGAILGSATGVRWRPVGRLPARIGQVINGIGYRSVDGFTYVAGYTKQPVGDSDRLAVVLRSKDLTTWDEVWTSPYPGWFPLTAAITKDGLAMGGINEPEYPWMATSRDGVSWELSAGGPGLEQGCTDSVAVDESAFVAIGAWCPGASAWTRQDGPATVTAD
jgi:hypothetical protein